MSDIYCCCGNDVEYPTCHVCERIERKPLLDRIEDLERVLLALTCHDGHLNHPAGECTGECAEVRRALAARGEVRR